MLNPNMKKVLTIVGRHTRTLVTGLTRMVYGTLTAGTFAVAFYGFLAIPGEGGYAAVIDFVAAVASLVVATACMYSLGINRKVKSERKGNK